MVHRSKSNAALLFRGDSVRAVEIIRVGFTFYILYFSHSLLTLRRGITGTIVLFHWKEDAKQNYYFLTAEYLKLKACAHSLI